MLTPPFKQHLSREFGAEERYHIYQRLIPIHQPAATDPHGLPEKSAKTQNASEKKGIWREKNMFSRQDVQQVFERHLHAWNDESQVKWQGMHGTLPPKKRTHFIGGCPTRCLMRIATVQRSSCKSRTPKKKFPTSISATCSEDTKTRDVNRHDIYWYTTYILCIYVYIKLPYKTSSHCLEDMSNVLIFHLGCQTASRGHQGGQGTACRRKRRRRSRSCCWVSEGSRTRRMR